MPSTLAEAMAQLLQNTSNEGLHLVKPRELPAVPSELTSELLHCLSTLPDPWPLAKITINLDTASQWEPKWEDFFFADEYVRRPSGPQAAVQPPEMQDALQAVKNVLDDLEMCVIEFFSDG